jgi:hypothetical protein
MVDSLTDALECGFDGSGNVSLVLALASLAVIALVPLIGPSISVEAHPLGQALSVLSAFVGF